MAISVFTDTSTAQDSRTLSWTIPTLASGDVVVVCAVTWDNGYTMNVPSGTGLSFTQRVLVSGSGHTTVYIWTAVASSGGSSVVVTSSVLAGGSSVHNGTLTLLPTADGYSLAGTPNTVSQGFSGGATATASLTSSAGNVGIVAMGDWTGSSGASRAWAGSPTEDMYLLSSGNSTHYGSHYTLSATSTTVGLTAPSTGSTFSLGAIEVLKSAGGTTHALASTGTGASTGSLAVNLVQATSSTGTGTSTGSINLLLAPGALSATGTGASAGSANLNATLALSATGTGQTTGSVNVTIGATTHALSATGTGTSTGSLAVVETLALSSTGSGSSTGSLATNLRLALSSTGTGQTAGSAALVSTLKISSTGTGTTTGSAALVILGPASILQLTATGTGQTSGSIAVDLIEPTFFFSPPTHEEPIRYGYDRMRQAPAPLSYYRLTYAASVVNVGGTWTPMRTPPPELLVGLVAGVDYFLGGYEYVIDRTTAQSLAAAGYTATQI